MSCTTHVRQHYAKQFKRCSILKDDYVSYSLGTNTKWNNESKKGYSLLTEDTNTRWKYEENNSVWCRCLKIDRAW